MAKGQKLWRTRSQPSQPPVEYSSPASGSGSANDAQKASMESSQAMESASPTSSGSTSEAQNAPTTKDRRFQIRTRSGHFRLNFQTSPSTASGSANEPQNSPTADEVKNLFDVINIKIQAAVLINALKQLLQTTRDHDQDKPSTSSNTHNSPAWSSLIQSGTTFMQFIDDHVGKFEPKLQSLCCYLLYLCQNRIFETRGNCGGQDPGLLSRQWSTHLQLQDQLMMPKKHPRSHLKLWSQLHLRLQDPLASPKMHPPRRIGDFGSGHFRLKFRTSPATASGSANEAQYPPTADEVKNLFDAVDIKSQADVLINALKQLLQTAHDHDQDKPSTSSNTHNSPAWSSLIQSGATFMQFIDDHVGKIDKKDSGGETIRIIGGVLEDVGKIHWAVAGLSIVGYLLSKIEKVSANRSECLQVLQYLLDLAIHIQKLNDEIPQEKLKNALEILVEGSMMCASLLQSKRISRFLKTSVNAQSLKELGSKIEHLYRDLDLTIDTEIRKQQRSVYCPISPPDYPDKLKSVGIEERQNSVMELLNMTSTVEDSPLAVVIYGFGGIGKTTLATAVVAKLDLQCYNYTRVIIDEVRERNNFKKMQMQILKDGFPDYTTGKQMQKLRDCTEGRDHLTKAFSSERNKAVFLFIDNALRSGDLKELLPEDLRGFPPRSRILVTTRDLRVTDRLLFEGGLERKQYHVNTLPDKYALKIFLNEDVDIDDVNVTDDERRLVKNCYGIPLVLKIAGAHYRKQGKNAEKCSLIFEALQEGKEIKEENLSARLINSVYDNLEESVKEAFLDICCFFHGSKLSHVEHIVGAEEVKSLQEAALITVVMKEEEDWTKKGWKEECVSVHDIIRAQGRSKSESNRIMNVDSWRDAVEDQTRLKEIKGVWLAEVNIEIKERDLNSMRKSLRVLNLGGSNISVSGEAMKNVTFKELRFLQVERTCIHCLPMNLEGLEKLRVLYVSVWTCNKLPNTLKVIKATFLPFKCGKCGHRPNTMPAVSNSSLEELNVRGVIEDIDSLNNLLTHSSIEDFEIGLVEKYVYCRS